MSQCGLKCTACPYVKPGTQIRISPNKYWHINKKVNCQSFNVVYLIECDKDNCRQQYVGETGRIYKFRLDEHRGYITKKVESQANGLHFNLPGHSVANLKATIIEQVKIPSEAYRKLNTYYNGINNQK